LRKAQFHGRRLPQDRRQKPLIWIASSKEDISALPAPVKVSFGYRLRLVQQQQAPHDVKALPQLGGGVMELRESFDGNAYRAMYVANLRNAVYVLHVFIKKPKSGIGLPKRDGELIRARLKRAREWDVES
jgi:phage-related protein